jgi:hypothetical protein
MTLDPIGMTVIGLIGLALISLALICRLGAIAAAPLPDADSIKRPTRQMPPRDVTLGFRDPYR